MSNLTLATAIIVLINVLLWFSQIAILEINPAGTQCYSLDGTIIDHSIIRSGNYSVASTNLFDDLPSSAGTISPSAGNIFTDIFNNILSWVKSVPGVKYVYQVVVGPFAILYCKGILPNSFVVGIGIFWYLTTFLILVAFLWGRE